MTNRADSDLLQALEYVLETLGRTCGALQSTLDAMERGERLPAQAIADYREQLANVGRDRVRLEGMISRLWGLTDVQ